jgi:S1-C subfamily serine protease
MWPILWIVVLPLAFIDIAAAQTRDQVLRGLSRIELVIENLGQDSKACGITVDDIRAAFLYPVSSSSLHIVKKSASPYVYLNINTIRSGGTQVCFSSVKMQVLAHQEIELEFSGRQAFPDIVLWEVGGVFTSAIWAHEKQISEAVERFAKSFISDWNLDNKPDPQGDEQSSNGPESDKNESRVSVGTGFMVTANGYLVTNEHVVSGCSVVSTRQGSNRFEGTVIDSDPANDLALINIGSIGAPFRERFLEFDKRALANQSKSSKEDKHSPRTNFAFATIRQSPPLKAGEQAISFGYPLSGALASEGNLTVGNVSALHGLGDDPKEIQITTPVQAGNSGGPLLDRNGNVIGVVAAKLNAIRSLGITGDLPQNVNFAIGLRALRSFLGKNNVQTTETPSLGQLDPSEIGDHARLFTYLIECDPRSASDEAAK